METAMSLLWTELNHSRKGEIKYCFYLGLKFVSWFVKWMRERKRRRRMRRMWGGEEGGGAGNWKWFPLRLPEEICWRGGWWLKGSMSLTARQAGSVPVLPEAPWNQLWLALQATGLMWTERHLAQGIVPHPRSPWEGEFLRTQFPLTVVES